METAMVELNTRFISILERAADLNRVIDLQDLLERFAFDNICRVAFNIDPCCLAGDGTSESEFMKAFEEASRLCCLAGDGTSESEFMKAFEEASRLCCRSFFSVYSELYKIKKLLNVGSESKLKKSIITVHKIPDDIIKSRMEASVRNQTRYT
ncbi:hypothetical protein L2E82_12136 [Cichorium intybus]|uniref:Uncharacterized protein n=1 Tax=Cichorium intybus TaxID=13427 RepID=A0ACB9GGC6_CICIN|nr:hypothetical protein L2E82_12136 [Cichorium intybus]